MPGTKPCDNIAVRTKEMDALSNRTLVIGNLARWKSEGRITVALNGFQFTDFGTLTLDIFTEFAPEIILSPLFGDNFDALDVAAKLSELRFAGRYRAISDNLPCADIIRKEVRSHAPDIDFDLMLMPAQSLDTAA